MYVCVRLNLFDRHFNQVSQRELASLLVTSQMAITALGVRLWCQMSREGKKGNSWNFNCVNILASGAANSGCFNANLRRHTVQSNELHCNLGEKLLTLYFNTESKFFQSLTPSPTVLTIVVNLIVLSAIKEIKMELAHRKRLLATGGGAVSVIMMVMMLCAIWCHTSYLSRAPRAAPV